MTTLEEVLWWAAYFYNLALVAHWLLSFSIFNPYCSIFLHVFYIGKSSREMSLLACLAEIFSHFCNIYQLINMFVIWYERQKVGGIFNDRFRCDFQVAERPTLKSDRMYIYYFLRFCRSSYHIVKSMSAFLIMSASSTKTYFISLCR